MERKVKQGMVNDWSGEEGTGFSAYHRRAGDAIGWDMK